MSSDKRYLGFMTPSALYSQRWVVKKINPSLAWQRHKNMGRGKGDGEWRLESSEVGSVEMMFRVDSVHHRDWRKGRLGMSLIVVILSWLESEAHRWRKLSEWL